MPASTQIGNLFSGSSSSTTIIPVDRLAVANWQNAGLQSLGGPSGAGIPNRTTICATLSPLGGGMDDTAQINAAISSCPTGQVVLLNAGTFDILSNGYILINKGITLRGAGAGVTIIQKPNGATAETLGVFGAPGSNPSIPIIVGAALTPQGTDPANPTGRNLGGINGATNLTADAVRGAYSVNVASTSGLSVGQFVVLDEMSGSSWQPDTVVGNSNVTVQYTATITIGTPTVISVATPVNTLIGGPNYGTPIVFTNSGGALPTGIVSGRTYYVTNDSNFTYSTGATTFAISDTYNDSIVGTGQINTTGTQSGTQTATVTGFQIWAPPDYRISYIKHNPMLTTDQQQTNANYPYQPFNADEYSRLDRVTNEIKQISAISGSTVTFNSPITISYRVANTAQIATYYYTFVQQAGIENLSVFRGDNGNIAFQWCAYCWAKNIESHQWLGVGIDFVSSFRNELRASYSHNAASPQPGGGAYAIALDFASSEILIENNISIMSNKVIVGRAAGAGSVVAYNYMDDAFINYNEAWIEIGLNASHYAGSHHVLFEGNQGANGDSDDQHGGCGYMTHFRNWYRGTRLPFVNAYTGDTVTDGSMYGGPQRTGAANSYSNWHSFVGNVLGASGQMSYYIESGYDIYIPNMWMIGWNGDWDLVGSYDTNVVANIIRDGNFDWLLSSQEWYNTPGGFTIPASLYLPNTPAFFGGGTWPWVNPNNGSTGPIYNASSLLPAAARYFNNTPNVTPND